MRRFNKRAGIIVAYPVLVFLDIMISLTTSRSYFLEHRATLARLECAWRNA